MPNHLGRYDMTGTGTKEQGPLPPLLLTLTVVTGVVDAVSILRLGRVFVANMTGNVVFLPGGIAAGRLTSGPTGDASSLRRRRLSWFSARSPSRSRSVGGQQLGAGSGDSRLGGGSGARTARRILAVAAMLIGAFVGALLLRELRPAAPLGLATALLILVAAAAGRRRRVSFADDSRAASAT
jgi:hypothetical protein